MTRLHAFLRRHARVALDTNVLIYELEGNPRYSALTHIIFDWIEQPGHSAVTSTVTMTELLVYPYREGDEETVNAVYANLVSFPNLEWIPPGLEIADLAASLRAQHRLRTPDALQAATAISARATALITNDAAFRRVEVIETLLLDEIL